MRKKKLSKGNEKKKKEYQKISWQKEFLIKFCRSWTKKEEGIPENDRFSSFESPKIALLGNNYYCPKAEKCCL